MPTRCSDRKETGAEVEITKIEEKEILGQLTDADILLITKDRQSFATKLTEKENKKKILTKGNSLLRRKG